MKTFTCKFCKATFLDKNNRHRVTCSYECAYAWRTTSSSRKCLGCSKIFFTPRYLTPLFCSKDCMVRYRKPKNRCRTCGGLVKKTAMTYCSLQCRQASFTGECLTPNGILLTQGKKYKHVLVAENLLGRPIRKNDHILFMDKDRTNCDPSNLLVTSGPQGKLVFCDQCKKPRFQFSCDLLRSGERKTCRECRGKRRWEPKKCSFCSKKFAVAHKLQKFCSKKCQVASITGIPKVNRVRVCCHCRKEFLYQNKVNRFCSHNCYAASRIGVAKVNRVRICLHCKKQFLRREIGAKFCSFVCYSDFHRVTKKCFCGKEYVVPYSHRTKSVSCPICRKGKK